MRIAHPIDSVRVQLVPTRTAPKAKINNPEDVVKLVRELEDADREYAKMIFLDTKNQVIGIETISIGSLNASIVHPREALKGAILSSSASTIFIHNHPSGICEPSNEDVEISGKLKEAFETVSIALLDSIIVGKGCYYSLRETGFITGKTERVPVSGKVSEPKTSPETKDKTVYIAGMPEAVKDNRARMQELGNMLREGGYGVTGRPQKEPWQMTREDFAKTAIPLLNRKDFIKAWLKDNEEIPDLVKPGFNYIEQRNGSLLVFGNQRGQAIGIISIRKDAVEHIAVSDRYKDRGIATQLLEESRKYGVRRIVAPVSPEVAGIAHRFMVKIAFMEGKPVPPDVLREYPDLMTKVEKQRWRYK